MIFFFLPLLNQTHACPLLRLLFRAAGAPQLSTLLISRSRITNQGFCEPLSALPQLTSLALDHTAVEDSGIAALCQGCPRLCHLDLWYCHKLSDACLSDLSSLHSLSSLVLDQVQVSDTGMEKLHGASSCASSCVCVPRASFRSPSFCLISMLKTYPSRARVDAAPQDAWHQSDR